MPLYSLISLHFASLIFPHSHLLCWGTCLDGKSISQNPVDRRWDPEHVAMFAPHAWHHHVIWIARHQDVFFMLRRDESPKVTDPDCRAGAQVFPSPIVPKDSLSHELYAVRHCHATTAPSCLTSEASCVEQLSKISWEWPDKQQNWLLH